MFLKDKFKATKAELQRPQLKPLAASNEVETQLRREEFDKAVRALNTNKSTGPDNIPSEVFKFCPAVQEEAFNLLKFIWRHECIPKDLVLGEFVMLWKKKGSTDDPSKYRCICLLNHLYKILSTIILNRLLEPVDGFLKDWQAGFRQKRGCRDNTLIFRTLCHQIIKKNKTILAIFIDYKAAFDSVSHKCIDVALEEAGASNKIRAIYRAIYKEAAAFTSVPSHDGKKVSSDTFGIRRGVLQGDITSPVFFIIVLDLIANLYDVTPMEKGGLQLAQAVVNKLAYADDVLLLEEFDNEEGQAAAEKAAARVSERLHYVAWGSKEMADMELAPAKTKALQVGEQDPVEDTTPEEARAVSQFPCPHPNCNFVFASKRGCDIHAGRCEWSRECEFEKILAERGPRCAKQYLIRWKGYDSDDEEDTWETRSNLHPEVIKDYEVAQGIYDHQWSHRCQICDLPCVSKRGVTIHMAKAHKQEEQQKFKGTVADAAVKRDKMKKAQAKKVKIFCGETELENAFIFCYLGSLFSADADQDRDIRKRIALARKRFIKLRHVFGSDDLTTHLKIRLYEAAVCSVLVYGCESWALDRKAMRRINGANSQMLAIITGRPVQMEARPISSTINLVRKLRIRRHKWAGHILRGDPSRLIHQAVLAQWNLNMKGGLLMDAPTHGTFQELIVKAKDRATWQDHEKDVPQSHLC